jgi:alkylation response protein AidB-like acyl-CoA dehydrogenase
MLGTVLAAEAIGHAGSPAQRERWLPRLAAGEITGAAGVERDGAAELVPDGPRAAVLVLVDEAAGDARLLAADEAETATTEAIDPTRRYARVTAPPEAGEALGCGGVVCDRAAVAVSAELVGLCRRALDMTVAYVKDRRQFGVPVGGFQAVQHTAAEMLRHTEAARAAAYYAAWTADAEPVRLPLAAAMAKAAASDAARAVTASAIQLHGGIGFTWEADVHWLFKRAQIGSRLFGGAAAHRARVTRLVAAERAVAGR